MEKLKKYIVGYFILFAFALSAVESILDSCFDEVSKYINDSSTFTIALILYLTLCVLMFLLFSKWFAVTISRKIAEETNRQNKERNLLFANILHDLKTPMTIILGFSQALMEKRVNEEEKTEVIHSIYEKSKKSDELLTILFQYAKLDASNYAMHFEQQDICRIVRDEVASLYEIFEDKNMDVSVEIPDQIIMKKIDKIEFRRAIGNLLINACKHNKNGSKVLIRLWEDHNKTKIIVADNGVIIPNELESNLFEPFVCADESRNSKGGNGLGLAITKKIVEKHGGHISIDSKIESYTKGFVIEL